MHPDIVTQFCTPPAVPRTEAEKRILASAEQLQVPFEGGEIPCYSWGRGRTIFFIHG
jgi:hypothetical protein